MIFSLRLNGVFESTHLAAACQEVMCLYHGVLSRCHVFMSALLEPFMRYSAVGKHVRALEACITFPCAVDRNSNILGVGW